MRATRVSRINSMWTSCSRPCSIESRTIMRRMMMMSSSTSPATSLYTLMPSLTPWLDNLPLKERIFEEVVSCSSLVSSIPADQRRRLYDQYYWPLLAYISHARSSLSSSSSSSRSKPLFLGLSAPQGCGKTTVTSLLQECFKAQGIKTIAMSLDDFYLTGRQQDELAASFPHNPLLQYRGNAGTHDLDLALETLQALQAAGDGREEVRIPRYDKSLRQGRGDRLPRAQWTIVAEAVDIVLFEGWMLGFTPRACQALPEDVKEVDAQLERYRALHDWFDLWLVLAVKEPSVVYEWRLQAESNMRNKGLPGLSDEQVKDFVARFMPAYQTYLPDLYQHGPQRRNDHPVPVLQVLVDETRFPVNYSLLSASAQKRSNL